MSLLVRYNRKVMEMSIRHNLYEPKHSLQRRSN